MRSLGYLKLIQYDNSLLIHRRNKILNNFKKIVKFKKGKIIERNNALEKIDFDELSFFKKMGVLPPFFLQILFIILGFCSKGNSSEKFLKIFAENNRQIIYRGHVDFNTKAKFKMSTVGGLSGLVQDLEFKNIYWSVSDDRGNKNEPRIYKFRIEWDSQKKIQVSIEDVVWLKTDMSRKSHSPILKNASKFSPVIDMEGIALLPWGDFLISSEGDLNHRPRVQPQIFSVNPRGVIQKDYPLLEIYLSEKVGRQSKGLQNNLAFEGLASSPDSQSFLLAAEAPLLNEVKESFVRFQEYYVVEPWVLKPRRTWKYPLQLEPGDLQRGVSEVLYYSDNEIWVLERALVWGAKGLGFKCEIYQVFLQAPESHSLKSEVDEMKNLDSSSDRLISKSPSKKESQKYLSKKNAVHSENDLDHSNFGVTEAKDQQLLEKRKIFDFSEIESRVGAIENFEAMAWGPSDFEGNRSLILLSDDNFRSSQKTQFIIFSIKEPLKKQTK